VIQQHGCPKEKMQQPILFSGEADLKVATISYGKLTWVYVEKPRAQEVAYLAQKYHFHPLNLDDIVSKIQRPKIDEYDDHVFTVLHFPVFDKKNKVTTPSEVDFFVGENYVVSIHCNGNIKPLASFFKECQFSDEVKDKYMSRSAGFLYYHILDGLVNYCFPIINKLIDNTEKIEDLIFARAVPETVREILIIRRDLIALRRVIHPQIAVVESLEHKDYPFFKEDQDVYFGDIADHIRKLWDSLEDCKEVVDALADTSNWLTSHRIQEIMRVLTIASIIIAPSTLIASIYGMNVLLPGQSTQEFGLTTFILVIAIMVLISLGMLLFFRRKNWI
jgi:magnesium transporter